MGVHFNLNVALTKPKSPCEPHKTYMFPKNLNKLLKRQKNKDFQGVTASNTREWRGWAEPPSLLRIHALISRR
jgi:hypothetical protein